MDSKKHLPRLTDAEREASEYEVIPAAMDDEQIERREQVNSIRCLIFHNEGDKRMNAMTEFKGYSEADKTAARELQAYAAKKTGKEVKLGDIIAAVTPGLETPEFLKNV